MYNRIIRLNQMVEINSNDTERTLGTVKKIENDNTWGRQFLVCTHHDEWGDEYFWFTENEIHPVIR